MSRLAKAGLIAGTALAGGAVFWALFYSVYTANFFFVIPLRNWYKLAPYTILAQEPLEFGANTYTFSGTFEKLDLEKGTIYLRGRDKKIYPFLAGSVLLQDSDTWLKIAATANLETLSAGSAFPAYRQLLVNEGKPAAALGSLAARWNDKRSLARIERDYAQNKDLPLNNDLPQSLVLAEFK